MNMNGNIVFVYAAEAFQGYVQMRHVMRKSVFGVSDQVRHKPGCTATEDGLRLEISDLGKIGIVLSLQQKKALISFTVTVQMICAFVFAHAKNRLSHDAAHIKMDSCRTLFVSCTRNYTLI